MQDNKNKDITQQYNDFKEYNQMVREIERNEKKWMRKRFLFLKIGILIFILLLVFFIIISPIGKELDKYRNENSVFNIMEQLTYRFDGTFEILSPQVDLSADITPNTVYTIQDQDGIIFQVSKNGTQLSTDYNQHLYKKYLLNYLANTPTSEISYEEKEQAFAGTSFYTLQIKSEIPSYDTIDFIMENRIKSVIQYLEKEAKKDFKNKAIDFKIFLSLHNFTEEISYYEYTTYGFNYLINKVKVNYINYLTDGSFTDNAVSAEEMNQYYRPPELDLYVNDTLSSFTAFGRQYPYKAIFDYGKMDYFVDINLFLPYLNQVNIKKNPLGDIQSFVYNNKKYTINDHLDNEIRNNKVSIFWTSKMIENFFDCEIIYDYHSKTFHIQQ